MLFDSKCVREKWTKNVHHHVRDFFGGLPVNFLGIKGRAEVFLFLSALLVQYVHFSQVQNPKLPLILEICLK